MGAVVPGGVHLGAEMASPSQSRGTAGLRPCAGAHAGRCAKRHALVAKQHDGLCHRRFMGADLHGAFHKRPLVKPHKSIAAAAC